jgi:hypothetical protein
MYILEPYKLDSGASSFKNVQNAVAAGVPNENVFTQSYEGAGAGVVDGATLTQSIVSNSTHVEAPRTIGKFLAQKSGLI